MKQKLINVCLFTVGAAVGSLVTWRLMKAHYESYCQEEIDKFVDEWSKRTPIEQDDDSWKDEEGCDDEEEEDDSNETEIYDYHRLAKKYSGEEEGDNTDEDDGPGFPYVNGPVVISPDEFGDGNFNHSLVCLTYYSDGVLANDWFEEIDIEETIGEEALEHFGDYTDDVVHVRNEQNNADYEVVRDPRTFAEVSADDPLMAKYAT